ncbi:CorA metal ion transporter [Coemansia guatemalensis]|uniref:CorA metal ion transporter n=1 Tax=Coemansia guatemalensis TaxID=2761395 RepID=A0A9W8HZH0_9FUNG|nr:CorA metal ion transporter [Coemansia guatemalensis]
MSSSRGHSQHPSERRRAGYLGSTMDTQLSTMSSLDQGGITGFNGVVFGSGGTDLGGTNAGTPATGIHESPFVHTHASLHQRPVGHSTQISEHINALQRENLQLRRANQALVVASDARRHAAIKLLGEFAAPDNEQVSDDRHPDVRRKQLTRLLLALLDPDASPGIDPEQQLAETKDGDNMSPQQQQRQQHQQQPAASPSPPPFPASAACGIKSKPPAVSDSLARPSRPVSRTAGGARPGNGDWDSDALREVSSRGRLTRNKSTGDRYAAESRKAIGSHSSYGFGRRLTSTIQLEQQQQQQQQRRGSLVSAHSGRSNYSLKDDGLDKQQQSEELEDRPGYSEGLEKQGYDVPGYRRSPHSDKVGLLATSLLDPDKAHFVQSPNTRFVLYSPSSGIFQAPTLDTLRSGKMTLADIIEASIRSITLEQLQKDRIAENEIATFGQSTDRLAEMRSEHSGSDGDDGLLMMPHESKHQSQQRPPNPSSPPPPMPYSGSGCFWLDITDPTPEEMASLARVFGIHPLTVEDIMSEDEGRDKFETFSGYNFLVYRTIDYGEDAQSNYEFNRGTEGIATASFSIVLKQTCVLTFHRARELNHLPNVISRLRDLMPPEDAAQNSVQPVVTPAYIAYTLVDDITDTLAPEMRSIELEVDAADELVLILSTNEQADMLRRIGSARRKILTLWRLLQGKPDVIRAFSKLMERQALVDELVRSELEESETMRRTLDQQSYDNHHLHQSADAPLRPSPSSSMVGGLSGAMRRNANSSAAITQLAPAGARRKGASLWPAYITGSHMKDKQPPSTRPSTVDLAAPTRADFEGLVTADEIAHYLSDVYDHLVSLVGSSSHCDMVLSRAHSNYLARLSLGLGESTVETNLFASRWTVIGSILIPLNIVTGLWGMNVKVPGQDRDDLLNFFLILAGCLVFVLIVVSWARYKKVF